MPYIVSKTDLMLHQFQTFVTKSYFFVLSWKRHQFDEETITGGHPKMGKEEGMPFTLWPWPDEDERPWKAPPRPRWPFFVKFWQKNRRPFYLWNLIVLQPFFKKICWSKVQSWTTKIFWENIITTHWKMPRFLDKIIILTR